jgi:hypothetical protein
MVVEQQLLQEQTTLSLEQRCADIKWRFHINLSVKTLRIIYDDHGISLKKVQTKTPETPSHLMDKRKKEWRELRYDLEYIYEKHIKLYWLDEATFTCKDYLKHAWSNKGKNILVDFQRTPKAVSCSIIMDEEGIVAKNFKIGAFKKEDHWSFLESFREGLAHDERVALYSDGLSFHHSLPTRLLMKDLDIYGVKSIAYTPTANPCEIYWKV